MLPWHCLIYYFSIVLNCVIKCSCHPWIRFDFFFTYGKSVLVNKLNVVNHSHSYIHKKSICIIINSLVCQGYSLKFANQSKYRSEYCRPIKSFLPTLVIVFTRDWKKSSTPVSVCKIRIDQTFFLGFFYLLTYESICCCWLYCTVYRQYKYIVHCMNLNLDFCFDCYYYCFFIHVVIQ